MKVCKIAVTPDAEKTIGYIARVSNPANQENPKVEGLLKYCIKHGHWSVFEQATLTVEINTTRAIAAQILRHRSFTFQEFSQRYADSSLLGFDKIPLPELRSQDTKNRQNSIDDVDPFKKQKYEILMQHHFQQGMDLYQQMLDDNIAKECARNVLPLCVPTKMYMTGNLRNWIHYISLRSANGTQKEHMDIAKAIKKIFMCEFPTISRAMEWCDEECDCPHDYDGMDQPCIMIL
ncbi:thymidylate synthetase [Synechococcus phage ACG-2014d]|jgi:thymidylate synthase (FAD)|uniref:Thymidylate synthetase n=1 Tax=Synechococcus phage ACG-2014d TaxID=1493509 RepID=A0A0E3F183_9CAUD|nr:thymidylate synthase [Synechococcus phage ACG-2014d]YP_010355379.1 thymidylate synthase [Synechococcus phage ACG-2014d]AIX14821.1 thymidylate synthetase [Synechococcus phage ACG-2014d]AIX15038.1 thymidylate synthetase [Synechococcus phage ACG-2014d]AIX15465.1 thymidylate synthetase [Synechococcus phage ACG-2014d]AIX15686.1 thymidylate synthetase [Synechococcus phage ACG-2014d]AIX16114.1 thymidylate synthetase [Synechococcus phage ACG-2014d]